MRRRRPICMVRASAALMLLLALPGCVAALAVPAMTAAGVLSERKPVEGPAPVPADMAPAPEPAPDIQLTDLTELPPPSVSAAGAMPDPWRAFASFALGRAAALSAGDSIESALLAPGSVTSLQLRKRECPDREPAVLVDLDPGKTAADGDTLAAPPGAVAALASLREAGVVVLWISQAGTEALTDIAEGLKATNLDPTGRDPILLVRYEEERKQVLREEANESVCVLAIAGDERGDFDELFDYLRDPALGAAYDAMMGTGWFLVPSPSGGWPAPADILPLSPTVSAPPVTAN